MTQHQQTNIDIISAALHGDKRTVLHAELDLVRGDLAERHRINEAQRTMIEEELAAVRQRILDLSPEGTLPGEARHTRGELEQEKEYRMLTRELRAENRSCWNDVQHLRDVERNLVSQLLFLDQREQRLREFV